MSTGAQNGPEEPWSPDGNWILGNNLSPFLMLGPDDQVLFANPAAHRYANVVAPGVGGVSALLKLMPRPALEYARAEGIWVGTASVSRNIKVGLRMQSHFPDHPGAVLVMFSIYPHTDRSKWGTTLDNQSLVDDERLATIGQLAAGIAHEINNPIGYVLSNLGSFATYADALAKMTAACKGLVNQACGSEARADFDALHDKLDIDYILTDLPKLLDESREGILRVQKIVQDLLEFSQSQPGAPVEPTDLHAGIESTINLAWGQLKAKTALVRNYGELPLVECCPAEINQVVMNLLVNAAYAIRDHGEVRISTGADLDAGEVWIEVADTGEGIPAENLNRIFDPYYTTKPVGQGTGIGLAIVYSIVAAHNGRIEVSSRVGEGAVFTVVLPAKWSGDRSRCRPVSIN